MIWLTVDENGIEGAHEERPYRDSRGYWDSLGSCIELPDGSIEKLIGRKLTWKDESVELE